MTTFLNLPFHHPPTTLAGYDNVISAQDKLICRYKLQLVNNLKEAQMKTFLNFPAHHSLTLWPCIPK